MKPRVEPSVRAANGPIWCHPHEEHGFSILTIQEWRKLETAAGRPSSLEDFYAAHGLCADCRSYGARMVGWSKPTNEIEAKRAEELGLDELQLWGVCPTCQGTGKADRTKWKGLT